MPPGEDGVLGNLFVYFKCAGAVCLYKTSSGVSVAAATGRSLWSTCGIFDESVEVVNKQIVLAWILGRGTSALVLLPPISDHFLNYFLVIKLSISISHWSRAS